MTRTLMHLTPILGALLLSACAGVDRAYSEARDAREAVADRVDAAIVDKVCRMNRPRLLELVGGDEGLADAIVQRCAGRGT